MESHSWTEGLADLRVCSTYLMLFHYAACLLTLTRLLTLRQRSLRFLFKEERERESQRETGADDIGELNQRGGRITEGGRETDKEGER